MFGALFPAVALVDGGWQRLNDANRVGRREAILQPLLQRPLQTLALLLVLPRLLLGPEVVVPHGPVSVLHRRSPGIGAPHKAALTATTRRPPSTFPACAKHMP